MNNPPVTKQDVERELTYWLSQMPPDQLLEIISDKFHSMSVRDRQHRWELSAISTLLSAASHLMFAIRNKA